MSMWLREEKLFAELAPDRQANIEIVTSAYASMFAKKAYLTMAVTSGKRFYDVLDRYGVRSIPELEAKKPGALREEIILPNIEAGKCLAKTLQEKKHIPAIIVPGVFEARRQRWSQEEYMVLWLRAITNHFSELYLSSDWEYSNGGAMEFARAILLQFRCIDSSDNRPGVFDHTGEPMTIDRGVKKLVDSIRHLGNKGYDTKVLKEETGRLAGLIAMIKFETRRTALYHARDNDWSSLDLSAVYAAQSVGVPIHFHCS